MHALRVLPGLVGRVVAYHVAVAVVAQHVAHLLARPADVFLRAYPAAVLHLLQRCAAGLRVPQMPAQLL